MLIDKNIVRLDISMQDHLGVENIDGLQEFLDDFLSLLDRVGPLAIV